MNGAISKYINWYFFQNLSRFNQTKYNRKLDRFIAWKLIYAMMIQDGHLLQVLKSIKQA